MTNNITIPWEERPAGCNDPMWRYSKNPIINRYDIPTSNSILVLQVCSDAITVPCR